VGGALPRLQVVTFDRCLFVNNKSGPQGRLTQDGVIEAFSFSNSVIIKDTVFDNNDYSQPVNGVSLP
jgi:hypothetical protein